MANTSGIYSEHYNDLFPQTLRQFMAVHPVTHERTTQKTLADAVGVRPQTISQYAIGETQPTPTVLLKIANYFCVTVDFLLTGRRVENKPVREMLGLSEQTCENMKLVNDGYFEDYPLMLPLLDFILSDKDFYFALASAADSAMKRQLTDDANELAEFYEWKAAQPLQDYFIHALRNNVQRIYDERRGE